MDDKSSALLYNQAVKVVVVGGTGFIGSAFCARLAAAGDEAVALSGRLSVGELRSALQGAEAVVNLAGAPVAKSRWTAGTKIVLAESRLGTTRKIVAELSDFRVGTFVCASAVGYYGDRGDERLVESSTPGNDFLAGLCVGWEAEARRAEALGTRTVRLRLGVVLGRGGGALAEMLPLFRLGLGGPFGSGRQWLSWISLEDATGLIVHLLRGEAAGAVNATSPNPATNRDFAAALGRALRRPALIRTPAFALRLALGERAGLLLGGQRALPERALKAGYSFKHPDLDSALAAAL